MVNNHNILGRTVEQHLRDVVFGVRCFLIIDGLPTLASRRILTTYALLAALLLSNVAGWLHVGCCHPSDLASADPAAAATHACGCQHHCHSGPTDEESDPDSDAPPEHDSDRCSVCQSFFASRFAAIANADTIVWTPLATERLRFRRDVVSIESLSLNGLSVRGPPSA
ncbi:hypothetical protein [Rosistilla oblonga]|uniref:hypothetical protein n=1 Tax=Rosistilla oblonga TaxID=2527990 RepID=UPI003A987D95